MVMRVFYDPHLSVYFFEMFFVALCCLGCFEMFLLPGLLLRALFRGSGRLPRPFADIAHALCFFFSLREGLKHAGVKIFYFN